jgi:MoxR-like ATPase
MQKLTTGVDFLTEYRTRALSEIPLVSRSRELNKLAAAVASGSPALVEGSHGLGKTRLLLELKRDLARGDLEDPGSQSSRHPFG